VDERKHVYQPLKDILDGHKNGISTAADLKALADEVNYSVETYPCGTGFCNEDGVILLNNSISLAEYTNWPGIGHNHEGTMDGVEIQFAGIFDGQGNTIEGMTITHNNDVSFAYTGYDGSEKSIPRNDVGLFGSASYHATIKNLIVKGSVDINYDAITDSDGDYMWCYAGGVVGQAFGVQLQNLTSYVNFTTTHLDCKLRVGGIAARVAQEKVDGNHHDLKNYGTINVAHSKGAKDWEIIVGGIVGNINDGGAVDINFTDCENRGQVDVVSTAVSNSGGCFGFVSRLYEKDGLFKNCDNFANVTIASTSAGPVVGGVAGQLRHYDWEDCDNSGTVSFGSKSMVGAESYIGGVFGYTNARNAKANTDKENYAKVYIENCENSGAVKAEIECVALAGGVIGYVTWPAEVTDCTNKGTVNYSWTNATGSKTTGHVGGLIGKIGVKGGDYKDGIAIYDSVNEGVVSSDIDNNADAGWSYVGGIAGSAYGGEAVENAYGSVGAVVDGCENKGTVRCIGGLKFRTGGIVGLINRSDIFNCINSGTVQIERKGTIAKETVGGIAGFCENKYSYISGCENSGTTAILVPNSRQAGETTSNIYQCNAGICGLVGGVNVTISDCTHTGVLVSSSTGIHEWDSTKNVWVVNTADSPNYEYRGAIQGVGIKNSVIKDCEIGGKIGSVNTYDATTGEFTTKEVYELVNDETSTYHWRRWVYGYTAVIDVSTCTFGN
ncbi:MAG: hypothetical protein IJ348_04075, partial [Alistipes sp.]|nr:hypothetical protein [Alistipes sp.]